MISFKPLLIGVHDNVKTFVDSLHYHVGRKYDIQVLCGKVSESEFSVLEIQGKNIEKVNLLRGKVLDRKSGKPLREITKEENVKVVNSKWGSTLKSGAGAVVIITSPGGGYRRPLDKTILKAIDSVLFDFPEAKISTLVNDKFATIFISEAEFKSPELSSEVEVSESFTVENTKEE